MSKRITVTISDEIATEVSRLQSKLGVSMSATIKILLKSALMQSDAECSEMQQSDADRSKVMQNAAPEKVMQSDADRSRSQQNAAECSRMHHIDPSIIGARAGARARIVHTDLPYRDQNESDQNVSTLWLVVPEIWNAFCQCDPRFKKCLTPTGSIKVAFEQNPDIELWRQAIMALADMDSSRLDFLRMRSLHGAVAPSNRHGVPKVLAAYDGAYDKYESSDNGKPSSDDPLSKTFDYDALTKQWGEE